MLRTDAKWLYLLTLNVKSNLLMCFQNINQKGSFIGHPKLFKIKTFSATEDKIYSKIWIYRL